MSSLIRRYEHAINENIQMLAKRLLNAPTVDAARLTFKRSGTDWDVQFFFHYVVSGDWLVFTPQRTPVTGEKDLQQRMEVEFHNVTRRGVTSGDARSFMDNGNIVDAYEETAKLLYTFLDFRRGISPGPDLGGKGHLQINCDGTYEFEYERYVKNLVCEHKLEGHILVDPIRG